MQKEQNEEAIRIYCGDCLTVMDLIHDDSVDMILCDLPYGITDAKWDCIIPYDALWAQYDRVLKPNGAAVLFAVQPFSARLIGSNPKAYRYSWYWLKPYSTGFAYARYQPMRRVEEICVFYRRKATYNPQGLVPVQAVTRKRKAMGSDGIYNHGLDRPYTPKFRNWPVNVLEYGGEHGLHPTQKPVPLLEYLVRTYTNDGETILDNCMGSGSTGMAVMRVGGGRKFIGIERSRKFYDIACRRLGVQQSQ